MARAARLATYRRAAACMAVAVLAHAAIFAVSSFATTDSRRKTFDLPRAEPESTQEEDSPRREAAERRRLVQAESRPVNRKVNRV
jgi:hypothetical protein